MAEKEGAGEEEAGRGWRFVLVCSAIGPVTAAELPADWPAAGLAVDWLRGPHATAAQLQRGAAPAVRAAVAVQAKVQSTRKRENAAERENVVKTKVRKVDERKHT